MKLKDALKFFSNIFKIVFQDFKKFFQNLCEPFVLNLLIFNPFKAQ